MKNLFASIAILLIISCEGQKRHFEKIDFENPYKFSSEIESEIKKDTTSWKREMFAQSYGANSDYVNALRIYDFARNAKEQEQFTQKQIDSINSSYQTENAVEYIVEKASSNKVVIINEGHHNSMNRVFTKSLLQKLFEIGYKNIGFEGLSNGEYLDSILMKRKYPTQKTGYYVKDPQFGNLVRTALEIGYNVFPYEDTNHNNGKLREIEQAKNIQTEMEKRPNEKFLIHCGFGHVFEGVHESWEMVMAGRLTELTGIDPLTIDQIEFSERSKAVFNNPILNALDIKNPSVLIDQNGKPFKYEIEERWTDLAVFHPKSELINGRPNWLFAGGNQSVPMDLNDIDISFPIMVLAYKKGEDIKDGIPMDLIEVQNKTDKANLALRKGEYDIIIANLKGNARKFELSVD